MKKVIIILLILLSLSFAQQTPVIPVVGINDYLSLAKEIIAPLMITMVIIAASVYVIGQIFGGDFRAKATTWAESMLVAVGVSALVIVLMYFILGVINPIQTGALPIVNFLQTLTDLKDLAESSLAILIMFLAILAAIFYGIGMVTGSETRARTTGFANNLIACTLVAVVIYFVVFQIFLNPGGPFEQILGTNIGPSPTLSPYTQIIITVFFFISLIIFLTYLVSKVFHVPEWEAYLNVELSNLVKSFLLILFVSGFFIVASTVVSDWSGIGTTPALAAIKFLQVNVQQPILQGIKDVYFIQTCTSMLSVYARRMGESVLTRTYKVFPGIDTFVSISNVLAYGLVAVYGSISAQITLLYLVDSTMGTFFLPAGLILHFFPPTRDAGAFLIAFSIGFALIFPMGYLIDQKAYNDLGVAGYQSPTTLIWSICGPVKYGGFGYLPNPKAGIPSAIFGLLPGGSTIQTALGSFFSEGILGLLPMPEFTIIMRHFAVLSLLSLFIPALSMMVTIAFINSMTKFILLKV